MGVICGSPIIHWAWSPALKDLLRFDIDLILLIIIHLNCLLGGAGFDHRVTHPILSRAGCAKVYKVEKAVFQLSWPLQLQSDCADLHIVPSMAVWALLIEQGTSNNPQSISWKSHSCTTSLKGLMVYHKLKRNSFMKNRPTMGSK